MMDMTFISGGVTILGCAVFTVLIVFCVRSLSFRRSMAPVYFTFSLVSSLMSALYWVAYDLLRPDTRMPFVANEFGEIGLLLLLASALNAVFRGRFAAARREIVCAAAFAAACTALWIGWSGEWIEDLLSGLSFGYLLCCCVRSLKQSDALSRLEWGLLGAAAAVLLLLQGLTFLLPEPWRSVADYGAYAVMFALLAWWGVKLILALRRDQNRPAAFACSVSCFAWSISCMFMSTGIFYLAGQLSQIVTAPLMFLALRREEAAA